MLQYFKLTRSKQFWFWSFYILTMFHSIWADWKKGADRIIKVNRIYDNSVLCNVPSFKILYKFSSIRDLFWNIEDYFQVSWISPTRNNSKDSFQKYQSGQQRTTDFISIILGFDSALWQTIFFRKDKFFY